MRGSLAVTGATGNVGTPLVRALGAAGVPVRALARDPAVFADDPQVEPVVFDFTDPSTFDGAFGGVEVLFLVRPPALARPRRDLIPALERAVALGVRHVVFLSVQGVERLPMVPHAAIERWLRRSGLAWTSLRASFFDQNLLGVHGPAIRERGELIMPAGDGRTAFVDAEDVAQAAAAIMLQPHLHRRRAYTVTGVESLSYAEVATIMSRELERPIRYTRPGLVGYLLVASRQLHLPAALTLATSVVYTTARLGLAAGTTDELGQLLGRPPGTFAAFVRRERAGFTSSPTG